MTHQDLDHAAELSVAARDALGERMASTIMPYLALAVTEEDVDAVADLLLPLTRQELVALAVAQAAQAPHPRTRNNDGVVDEVAVARAAAGVPIPLTSAERREAVRLLNARGVCPSRIAVVLHMSYESATWAVRRIQAEQRKAVVEAAKDACNDGQAVAS